MASFRVLRSVESLCLQTWLCLYPPKCTLHRETPGSLQCVCGGIGASVQEEQGQEPAPIGEMLLVQSPKSQNSLPCGVLARSKLRESLQEAGGGEHLAGGCRCVCGCLPGGTAITATACDSAGSTRVQSPLVTVGDSGQGVQVTSKIRK